MNPVTIQAHVRDDDPITLEQMRTGNRSRALTVGSPAAHTPGQTEIVLYFPADGAALRRLRDTIDEHLGTLGRAS